MRIVFLAAFAAYFIAGAQFASAFNTNRVSWIPTTADEVVAYDKSQINGVGVFFVNGDGSYVSIYAGQHAVACTNSDQLMLVTTNKIAERLATYLTEYNPGTNSFSVEVDWGMVYDSQTGSNCLGGDNFVGNIIIARSAAFQFTPKAGGGYTIPPAAYQVTPDWFGDDPRGYSSGVYCVLPEIGKSIKAVEYFCTPVEPGGSGLIDWTVNGSDSLGVGKPFLYLAAGWISQGQVISTNGGPGAIGITIWYDDAHTDGTEFRWCGLTGITKTEIYPPSTPTLSIVPTNGQFVVRLANGAPGASYALESAFVADPMDPKKYHPLIKTAETNPAVAVVQGSGGVVVWTVPSGTNIFCRARLVSGGP